MTKLIALGGWSGAGKTTQGYNLRRTVPALAQAIVLDEDQVRRDLFGYDMRCIMPKENYSSEATERVRNHIDMMTRETLAQGHDVIDTSGFWKEETRAHVKALAHSCGADFVGIWLDAPRTVLEERITRRLEERYRLPHLLVERGHASDADLGIFTKTGSLRPPDDLSGWERVTGGHPELDVLDSLQKILGARFAP